jgi:hypothetical protein
MTLRILRDIWSHIKCFYDDKVHFLQLHYFYILVLSFISSACFYFQPGTQWNYIDALFMGTTATTNTGLNTIDMSSLSTWQLLTMYFSSFLGSHIMISIIIVYVRRHYFSKRFEDILIFNKAQRLRETNRRKFENNIQEMERQRRKSVAASLAPKDQNPQNPLRRRLSFISVRSSPDRKDEENNLTTLSTSAPRIKKSRFSAPRPLSTGFSDFDLLSHFRKKSNEDKSETGSLPDFDEEALQNQQSTTPEEDPSNNTKSDFSDTLINHPHQAHLMDRPAHRASEDEDEVSSTIKNETLDDSKNRENIDASTSPLQHTKIRRNSSHNININNPHTRPLSVQSSSDGNFSNYSNNNNTNHQYFHHNSLTESILSHSSSHNSNFNNNKNTSKNNNSNPMGIQFGAPANSSNSGGNESSIPHHPTDTATTDENNESSSNNNISNTVSGAQGIAFADNIERQREVARRRLEQDRRYDDILQRMAGDSDSTHLSGGSSNHNSLDQDATLTDPESDDEEMKRIMREPIHKSELTRQQRYRLGGAEYRAIVFLTRLVPAYYLFCTLGFGFVFRIYVAASTYAQEILQTTNTNGPINVWFFSFFCSMSSFNNMGLFQVDASAVPFQSAPGLLVPIMFLILAGNTAYAIFLRLIIWIMYQLTPKRYSMRRETFRYLLDHPRRCYTTLFPSTQTKWLLVVLVGITAIEFTCFIALNYWLPVLEGINWGARVLDGLFQSVATRNGKNIIVFCF